MHCARTTGPLRGGRQTQGGEVGTESRRVTMGRGSLLDQRKAREVDRKGEEKLGYGMVLRKIYYHHSKIKFTGD